MGCRLGLLGEIVLSKRYVCVVWAEDVCVAAVMGVVSEKQTSIYFPPSCQRAKGLHSNL